LEKELNSAIITDFKIPTRMCVGCRGRFPQKDLYRFQEMNKKLVNYTKSGRSFYICSLCMKQDKKKIARILNGKFKIKNIEELAKY